MKIVIVDDDVAIAASLCEALEGPGVELRSAHTGREAIELIMSSEPDIVLLDLVLPEMNGMEIMKACSGSSAEFIMITGFGSIETAIEAMKLGAYEYLTKPINLEELRMLIQRIRKSINLQKENTELKSRLLDNEKDLFPSFVGVSDAIQNIKSTITQVAAKKITVLIDGDSGTGKEIVADSIYTNSNRKDKPYIKINCGALSQGILESELFGHEKGAFTGAIGLKKGIFESADTGTIFLDEIGEMPIESQVRLLRVLESGEYTRVGGVQPLKTDVRIIAATNKDLYAEVESGGFREDLYYRLKVINITIPALSQRRDDIPFLIKRFIEQYNLENSSDFSGFSQEVVSMLMHQEWKGNVRELKNTVHRILVFAQNKVVDFSDLTDDVIIKEIVDSGDEAVGTMDQIEKSVIERTLEFTGNNVRRVSTILDIPVRTLYRKLKKYKIQVR